MTLICRHYDEAILTKLALGNKYESDHKDRNYVNFLEQLQFICYQNDGGGLSYNLYKGVIATKSLLNFTNFRPKNSHRYEEELKIKFNAMTAIAGKFPNGKGFPDYLLAKEVAPLSWNDYLWVA